MKKFLNVILLLSALLVFDSCDIIGDNGGFDGPMPPNSEFSPCDDDDDDDDDDDSIDVSISELPDEIIIYLDENFPGLNITEAELELNNNFNYYEIHLGDGLELYFSEEGAFLCQDDSGNDDDDDGNDDDDDDGNDDDDDDDGNDDDDDISLESLPDGVLNFISDNYSGYRIESAEREDLCGGTLAYEIELEDGPGPDKDLYFSLEGEFLFAATDISVGGLPTIVTTILDTDFAGYTIEEDDIEEYELADGSFQYALELESESGDDIEIIFDADGNVACRED